MRAERADRPREPRIPDSVTAEDLDPAVLNELRTLPEELALLVARHLVTAERALARGETEAAVAHVAAAKRRAARVAAVREAAAEVAYFAGDYASAASEFRAVLRMSGDKAYLPMLADCERGLGRPQKAVDLIRDVDLRSVDPELRVELLLVLAGARADLGQVDAAVVTLNVPELTRLPKGDARARLQAGYASFLEQAGRGDEAHLWWERAADSDIHGVTEAAERIGVVAEDDDIILATED